MRKLLSFLIVMGFLFLISGLSQARRDGYTTYILRTSKPKYKHKHYRHKKRKKKHHKKAKRRSKSGIIKDSDIIIDKTKRGYKLYVKAKNSISAIGLITMRAKRYNGKYYILRYPEDMIYIYEKDTTGLVKHKGRLLGPDDGLYFLTTAKKVGLGEFGRYFMLEIPPYMEYGYKNGVWYEKFKVREGETYIGIRVYKDYPVIDTRYKETKWILIDTNQYKNPLYTPPKIFIRSIRRTVYNDEDFTLIVANIKNKGKLLDGIFYFDEGKEVQDREDITTTRIKIYNNDNKPTNKFIFARFMYSKWDIKNGLDYGVKIYIKRLEEKHLITIVALNQKRIPSKGIVVDISKPEVISEDMDVALRVNKAKTSSLDTDVSSDENIDTNSKSNMQEEMNHNEASEEVDNNTTKENKKRKRRYPKIKAPTSINIENKTNKNISKIIKYHVSALSNIENKNYDEAIKDFELCLNIYKGMSDYTNMANYYNLLGYCYQKKEDYENALEYYKKSLDIAKEYFASEFVAKYYKNVGDAYNLKGEFDEAIKYYQEAYNIYKDKGDRVGISVVAYNIATVLDAKGDIDSAIKYLKECLEIEKELNPEGYKEDLEYLKELEGGE